MASDDKRDGPSETLDAHAGEHVGEPPGGHAGDSHDPRPQRGRLWVSNLVVEKVASLAAASVPEVGAPPGRRARRGRASNRGGGRPKASARVRAGSARLELTMSVEYPASVSEVLDAVRTKVRADVAALTGVRVAHVDVDVPALSPLSAARSPRGAAHSLGPVGPAREPERERER